MVVNHVDNSALYLCTINREHNKPLTDKMHECFGLLQQHTEFVDALFK